MSEIKANIIKSFFFCINIFLFKFYYKKKNKKKKTKANLNKTKKERKKIYFIYFNKKKFKLVNLIKLV